jgi:hypothetical protein
MQVASSFTHVMKTIWTLLFLALIATTFGLALMFVAEPARTDRFWLAIGAIGLGEVLVWLASTFRRPRPGQQAADIAGVTMVTSTVVYFLVTLALGAVALLVPFLSFKMLLALHILALLALAFAAGISAIGARALHDTR